MRYLDADAVAAFGPAAAIRAITDALVGGLDPANDPPRIPVPLTNGQFLLMPSEGAATAGVKVATVAPGNPALGLPRIQAAYLLFDASTLALRAVLDGTALTTLRTPAVSVAAMLPVLPQRALRIAVVGAGPQAVGHVAALSSVRPLELVTHLVRDPSRAALPAVALSSSEGVAALAAADVVVCATSARTPLFAADAIREDAVVIAVGSHEADARELDASVLARSTVVVEDVGAALREAGDVVMAIADGALTAERLVPMRHLVTGAVTVAPGRPVVFKSVGMSWEDLVVAAAIVGPRISTQHPPGRARDATPPQ